VLRFAVTCSAALSLGGCFVSDGPLFTAADAAIPLPPKFYLTQLDSNGAIQLDKKGQASIQLVTLSGRDYVLPGGARMTLAGLDPARGIYVVQYQPTPKPGPTWYELAAISGGRLALLNPPERGKSDLDQLLQSAGVKLARDVKAGETSFKFDDRGQLLAAMRVYAGHLTAGSGSVYRIAATDEEIARLRSDATAAQQAAAAAAHPAAPPASPPVAAREDPGADKSDPGDVQAAYPSDPMRMAQGVAMDKIVPRLALEACQRAVAQYPHTARFRLQLGRAFTAAGRAADALQALTAAAEMGYPAAWLDLGNIYSDGTVPVDAAKAAAYFRRAIAAGLDAREGLWRVAFTSEGYSNPAFFDALYNGAFSRIDSRSVIVYLQEFLSMFHNTDGCRDVIDGAAYAKITMGATVGALGQWLGGLQSAGPNTGNLDDAFKRGWNAGANTSIGMAAMVSKADKDAQLFFDRHGCDSPVARRFFGNLEVWARH
jgi:hypothetical protein